MLELPALNSVQSLVLTANRRCMTTFVRITQERMNVSHIQQNPAQPRKYYDLFNKSNPNKIQAGAIVQITSLTSTAAIEGDDLAKTNKFIRFAGIVLGIQYKGIDTSIRVRNYVLKTGVEQVYKIYSPLIHDIQVLNPKASPKFIRKKLYYIRENPKLVKWTAIDELVKKSIKK